MVVETSTRFQVNNYRKFNSQLPADKSSTVWSKTGLRFVYTLFVRLGEECSHVAQNIKTATYEELKVKY